MIPPRSVLDDLSSGTDLSTLYSVTAQRARRAVERNQPFVGVVMKNVAHLERMARTLHSTIYPAAETAGRQFHLLVIDDEADDSSVMDSGGAVEATLEQRQIPRRIVDLWESRSTRGETSSPNLFATYLAYTATPQANFLQDPDNPLAPRDFVVSLRTPGAVGDPSVRSPSYRVPEGVDAWYTGAEMYYRTLVGTHLCQTIDGRAADEVLKDSIRAYLIATAIRHLRDPTRLGPASSRTAVFADREEATKRAAKPASMLIHPGVGTDQHFAVAEAILRWSAGEDGPDIPDLRGRRTLRAAGIESDMDQNEQRWLFWFSSYERSATDIEAEFQLPEPRRVPARSEWRHIRRLILDEVIPATEVAVINSDENADDRPGFSPVEVDGAWRAAPNLSTIFVSGNVMSRGLTLEGLTTTLFTRSSDDPLADTQMQMQRWFGYRGSYLDLCRVFLTSSQLRLFKSYHENDEALRREILDAMTSGPTAPDVTVLQGRTFRATGKISDARGVRLWPGPKPFIRHMNPPGHDEHNLRVVSELFSEPTHPTDRRMARRGRLLTRTLDLAESASLLDRLRYVDHGPGPESAEAARWKSVERHAGLTAASEFVPLYRSPLVPESTVLGMLSVYSIAAYLRLWAVALERRIPGMVTTDEPPVSWSLIDLDVRSEQQPRFRVGLRMGTFEPLTTGPLAGVRPMDREVVENDLKATWGSRNRAEGGLRGDELFDYELLGEQPRLTGSGARSPGSDGLILFNVIGRPGGQATIAVGLGLPLGGPDHVQARRNDDN